MTSFRKEDGLKRHQQLSMVWYDSYIRKAHVSQKALMSDIEKYLMITVSQKSSEGWRLTKITFGTSITPGACSLPFDLKWSQKIQILWSCWFEFCVVCFLSPSKICPLTSKTHPSLPRDDELIAVDELPFGYFRFWGLGMDMKGTVLYIFIVPETEN